MEAPRIALLIEVALVTRSCPGNSVSLSALVLLHGGVHWGHYRGRQVPCTRVFWRRAGTASPTEAYKLYPVHVHNTPHTHPTSSKIAYNEELGEE